MSQSSSRPFESLDWYRDAARNGFRPDRSGGATAWLQGPEFLKAHLALFAVGIVALYVVNLIRSAEDIWAIQWILAWTMLVMIHAVALGLVWAIRQWVADERDEPLAVPMPAREFDWSAVPSDAPLAQQVVFRPAPSRVEQPPESTWQGWSEDTAETDLPAGERSSWAEASAGAWLNRPSRRGATNAEASEDASET